MGKKIFTVLMLLMAMSGLKSYAEDPTEPLELSVRIIDDKPVLPHYPKSPVAIPIVWQDGNELEIDAPHAEYVLNIVSDTTIVYSVVVPSNVSVIQLPVALSGNYELQLVQNNLCFYAFIEL